jgi:hypothetical protein
VRHQGLHRWSIGSLGHVGRWTDDCLWGTEVRRPEQPLLNLHNRSGFGEALAHRWHIGMALDLWCLGGTDEPDDLWVTTATLCRHKRPQTFKSGQCRQKSSQGSSLGDHPAIQKGAFGLHDFVRIGVIATMTPLHPPTLTPCKCGTSPEDNPSWAFTALISRTSR